MFSERIKDFRFQKQMPKRPLAEALNIDTAAYCKIEKGESQAKKEQVPILSRLLNVNTEHRLVLWLVDLGVAVVSDNQQITSQAFSLVVETLKQER